MGIPKPFKFVGRILIDVSVFFLIIVLLPGLPPNSVFSSYSLTSPRELTGTLAKNNKLSHADPLLQGELIGPESIAIRGDEIYTGIIGGDVVRIKDGQMNTIAKFGLDCGGQWDESRCGRPLGMRFDSKGKLVVADAYYGLYRVDVDKRYVELLLSSNSTIDGKKPMILNDLDVSKSGIVFLSDSSTKFHLEDSLLELLADGSGRLLMHDPKKNETTVLIDGLNFANGVQLFPDEGSVLVCETGRYRVWRYYLKGDRKGQKELFIDGLPGSPDNIRSNGKNGFFLSLVAPRLSSKLSLIDILGPVPPVRKFAARIMAMVDSSLQLINSVFPNAITQHAKYYVGHLQPAAHIMPKHAIILELNNKGEVIGSLQDYSGRVSHISEFSLDPKRKVAYLGSPYNNEIWKLKVEESRPQEYSINF